MLYGLSKCEQKIIEMMFGLNSHASFSLTEIGKHLNLSVERVRQIKEKALKKLSYLALQKRKLRSVK